MTTRLTRLSVRVRSSTAAQLRESAFAHGTNKGQLIEAALHYYLQAFSPLMAALNARPTLPLRVSRRRST
jgi:hypothetical protein